MKRTKTQCTPTDKKVEFSMKAKYVVTFMLCIVLTAFSMWGVVYLEESYLIRSLFGITAALAFLQAVFQLAQVDSEVNN